MNMQKKQKQKHGGGGGQRLVKVAMGLMGVCLAGYIIVPPLYWHISEALASLRRSSCPCLCDCSSQPFLSLSEGLNNSIFTDCMKLDPEVSKESDKSFTAMLMEEMKLKEAEALENQRPADMALLEAKKMASQYQKETDKCNSGMETCEEARERSEATLKAQKELTEMWELKARQKDGKKEPLSLGLGLQMGKGWYLIICRRFPTTLKLDFYLKLEILVGSCICKALVLPSQLNVLEVKPMDFFWSPCFYSFIHLFVCFSLHSTKCN